MAQYIDKDALVAEIERRINEINLDIIEDWRYRLQMEHDIEVMKNILSFLDTLEVKEANSVWHDAIELPDETSLILLSLKDGNFILADEKTAYIRELVDKWCYVSDI